MPTAEVAIMEARIARAINRLSKDGTDLLSGSDDVASILDLMEEYFDCDNPQGNVLRPSIIIKSRHSHRVPRVELATI